MSFDVIITSAVQTKELTNYMVQVCLGKFAASELVKKFPNCLWNPKIHLRDHTKLQVESLVTSSHPTPPESILTLPTFV